ncbi:MAG: copper resistance protein CopC [Ktedonobacteraceae bacterium]|nr:copper resistance protein CopC [Ktedonobacteraceae bacterium]
MRSIFYLFQKMRRMLLIALLLSLGLLFLFPANSQAHAILLRSDPAQDAVLNSAPTQVRMWFSEDLSPGISTATIINTARHRVDLNNAHISSGDTREMDVSLQPLLSPGTYIVLWTTQSADDGHVLRGSFLFYVAEPDGTVPKTNGPLPGQNTADSGATFDGPTFFSFLMITLVNLGAVFWVGAQLWRTFVLQLTNTESGTEETIEQRAEARFDRKFSLPLLLLLLLANIGVIAGQALTLTGGDVAQSFAPSALVSLATNGHFGTYWMMREIVILLAILLAAITLTIKNLPRRFIDAVSWLNLILGMALLIALTMSGHASAANSDVLVYAVMVDWLHLLAASLWIGGMMYISTTYLPTLQGNSLSERVRSLLTTLPHYSPLAITGVIIMAVTGPFNATIHMSSFDQLITTAYGRALVVKVLLVGALLLTSAIHVGLLRPRLAKDYKKHLAVEGAELREPITVPENHTADIEPVSQESTGPSESDIERQASRLTSVLRWEPLLGVAVLVCTGLMSVLAGTLQPAAANQAAPPSTSQVKPFTTTSRTSDKLFTFKLTVSPDRAGPNTFTVTVFDSHGVKDTNVGVSIYATMLDMNMGTTPINLQPDGKGNFSISGDLDMGGRWALRLEIRAPDLKLHEANVKIVAAD